MEFCILFVLSFQDAGSEGFSRLLLLNLGLSQLELLCHNIHNRLVSLSHLWGLLSNQISSKLIGANRMIVIKHPALLLVDILSFKVERDLVLFFLDIIDHLLLHLLIKSLNLILLL